MKMASARTRAVATEASSPRFPHHVRLSFDEVRRKWVVLAPEKVLWPDEVSVDILKLCDGQRTIGDIVDELATIYEGDRETMVNDVTEFLQQWSDDLLLRL
jgi:pyrroloquinoline quinone biosynthesis protein D